MFVGVLARVGRRLMVIVEVEHQLWSLECFSLRAGAKRSQSRLLGRLRQFSLPPGVGSLRRLACAHASHLQYLVGPRLHVHRSLVNDAGIQSQVAVVLSDAIIGIRYQK